ncbi:MAG: MurR/RpiR family transcriptional regulator [Erysipelotrichia bacterium]|nr:MurR/RpiR family transcriptional regulator [Erysipelotrichia bacterium]
MESVITSRIKGMLSGLTKAERRIADYIIQNENEVYRSTLAKVAEKAGVSEGSVVKFINKRLGYGSFGKFKIDLARALVELESQDDISNDSIMNLENEIDNLIHNCIAINKREKLIEAVKLIENANEICFFGLGTSGDAARIGAYRFLRAGLNTLSETDPHELLIHAALVKPDDLIIAVSYTGETTEMIEALTLAQKQNCRIIAITSSINSKLTELSTLTLLATSKTENRVYKSIALQSVLIDIFIIGMLYTVYRERNHKKIDQYEESVYFSIIEKRPDLR